MSGAFQIFAPLDAFVVGLSDFASQLYSFAENANHSNKSDKLVLDKRRCFETNYLVFGKHTQ